MPLGSVPRLTSGSNLSESLPAGAMALGPADAEVCFVCVGTGFETGLSVVCCARDCDAGVDRATMPTASRARTLGERCCTGRLLGWGRMLEGGDDGCGTRGTRVSGSTRSRDTGSPGGRPLGRLANAP